MAFLFGFLLSALLISAVRGDKEHPTRDELVHNRKEIQIQCSEENNVPPDYFEQFMAGRTPLSENGKCFMKCRMSRWGYLNEDGSLNEDKIRYSAMTYYNNPVLQEIDINAWLECGQHSSQSDSSGDGQCDSAFELSKCYFEQIEKAGVKVVFHPHPEE